LLGDGYAIELTDVDEHIGIDGLLAGQRSGESPVSLKRWLETRGAVLGQSSAGDEASPAKDE
jgi:hypothetical protein